MSTIKTNCELPFDIMDKNTELNDIDFVLFHLYDSRANYRYYYNEMRKKHPERLMIFDNSAYEFFVKGEQLDVNKYVKAIYELRPDFYILPDVLRDKEKTIEGVKKFISTYGSNIFNCNQLAVAQGSSSEDLVECLELYREMGIENVCIPFHLDFYTEGTYDQDIEAEFMEVYGTETKDIRYAMGRVRWVRQHYDLLKSFKYVHMLGSHCPLELVFHSDFNSMDTGYPVKCAIEGYELGKEPGKPNVIIDDFLDKKLDESTKELIEKNIRIFKSY